MVLLVGADDGVPQIGCDLLQDKFSHDLLIQLGYDGDRHHQVEGRALHPLVDVFESARRTVEFTHSQHQIRYVTKQLFTITCVFALHFNIISRDHNRC